MVLAVYAKYDTLGVLEGKRKDMKNKNIEELARAIKEEAREAQHGHGANVTHIALLIAIENAATALELLTATD